MAATHKSQIETSISRLNQTAYGTARTSGSDFRRILNMSQDVADLNTAFEDDSGYDQGSDLANDIWAITNDAGLTLNPDFCFQDAPFLFLDALGGYSTSSLDALTSLYTHTITPQSMNTSRQLPSRTILKKYGGLGLYLFRDMVNTQLVLSGGKTGRLKQSATYKGSGYYAIDPAAYTSPAIVADREWAYSGQASVSLQDASSGTAQVETATAAGGITGSGNATVIVTSANLASSPITLSVAVTNLDTAAQWAAKVRAALALNAEIFSRFVVSGSTTAIILTDRIRAADDGTLNISLNNGTCTGITPALTSVNTTAGVVGSYQNYTCDLELWTLTLSNPEADDGYRQCSPYLVAGNPKSGSVRSELLVGKRDYSFDFTARMLSTDKTRGWMKTGTDLALRIPIFGIDTNDSSCIITHDRARIVEAKEVTNAGGDFIGVSGKATLMATSGTIGLSVVFVNGVASYTS
jgi:hypothetical protein